MTGRAGGRRRLRRGGSETRLLATGFGPFPGVPVNPSEAIVDRLAAPAGVRLVRHRLETAWDALGDVQAMLRGVRVAVHVGVAPGSRRLRIETVAVDAPAPAPDVRGRLPRSGSSAGRLQRGRAVAMPLVAAARRAGVPAGISGDAGRYLCNALYGVSLAEASRAARPHLAVFVHVPPPARQRGRRLADLVAAVEAVVAALVRQTRPPRPVRPQPKSRSRAL